MANPLEDRLSQLKSQFATGQKELDSMHQRENELQVTLLKISGGIQVLEEELTKAQRQQQSSQG